MNFRKPIRLSAAAKAAGISPNTVRSWLQRGHIILTDSFGNPAQANGSFHEITLRGALRIGIVAELVGLGLSPKAANLAAMTFVDQGEGVSYWGGEQPPPFPRLPGQLFSTGETVLIVQSAEGEAAVLNITSETDLRLKLWQMGQKAKPVIIFPLNQFVVEFQSRLDVDA